MSRRCCRCSTEPLNYDVTPPLGPLLGGNHGIGAVVLVHAVAEVVAHLAGFALTFFFGFSRDRLAQRNRDTVPLGAGGEGRLVEADDGVKASEPAGV